METLRFLGKEEVLELQRAYGTPLFVYDKASLEARAAEVMAFPNAFGLTGRFAMKALPTAEVVRTMAAAGLHIDASSGFEAERAMLAGVPGEKIQLTAQQVPDNLEALLDAGILFNACSLRQLATYGALRPGAEVSVRINPGLGSGHSNRTNVGGPSSSFGIWHEHLEEVLETARTHNLRLTGMHTHVGSGSDPEVWKRCAMLTLAIVARMPEVTRLSLGGGHKVGRMKEEISTNLPEIGAVVKEAFETFARDHGRQLHLEVEPGTYLVANAGAVVATVRDIVDTGKDGYAFIKSDTGMTEVLRPSMYGAQHPIVVVPADDTQRGTAEYLVVGHCCESGDVLTPAPGDSEGLRTRTLTEAKVGDALVIEGAGAYCASMASKNYNSFPEAAEVMRHGRGDFKLIRNRQTLAQVTYNEL